MLHILALVFVGALIWIAILSIPLVLVGGLRWDDVRSLLLHYAYKSFTFEGDVIPGVRPFLGTRLVIRAFSREDDARTSTSGARSSSRGTCRAAAMSSSSTIRRRGCRRRDEIAGTRPCVDARRRPILHGEA